MNNFRNEPKMHGSRDESNNGMVKRYSHSPLAIEHFGIHASIQENGKVIITKVAKDQSGADSDEVEYDEVEVPATFIFKLATALTMTRKIRWVKLTEEKESSVAEG